MQTTAIGETVRRLNRQGQQYVPAKHKDSALVKDSLNQLNTAYDRYASQTNNRNVLVKIKN